MSKKKAVPKKIIEPQSPSPQTKKKSAKPAVGAAPVMSSPLPPSGPAAINVYRHEIDENTTNAPLIVDIPIAAGRGEHPPRPSFVGFTAEMAEDYWQDQFAFRVLSLAGGSVRVMIGRVDKGSQDLAWGVKLTVQVLVVDASVT